MWNGVSAVGRAALCIFLNSPGLILFVFFLMFSAEGRRWLLRRGLRGGARGQGARGLSAAPGARSLCPGPRAAPRASGKNLLFPPAAGPDV